MARPKGHPLNRDAFLDVTEKFVGKTITQVAASADMNRATLSGLVGGYASASVPVAHRLAQSLGCRVGTLFPTISSDADRMVAL